MDYESLDRFQDIVDEIHDVEFMSDKRRIGLRNLLINNDKDYTSFSGQSLLEDLYKAIFYYEDPKTTI